ERHPHLRIYTQILYSPRFKCKLRVVFLWNARTNKYALLFSTDISQDARKIVSYYQLRFQIEFIFRDAKQFTGLTHCQARGEDALDFHFNMSFAALNLYQYQRLKLNSSKSLNSFVRRAYNTKLIKTLFQQLSTEHELKGIFDQNPCLFNLSHHTVQKIINIGQMST
ncbi:MAG: transposase, partial [Chitinophagales bacterium]